MGMAPLRDFSGNSVNDPELMLPIVVGWCRENGLAYQSLVNEISAEEGRTPRNKSKLMPDPADFPRAARMAAPHAPPLRTAGADSHAGFRVRATRCRAARTETGENSRTS